MIAGSDKSDKPINFTGRNEVHVKGIVVDGSIVIGIRELILCSFGISSAPGHKIFNQPRIKLFKKINKSILSQITLCLEDDDHKPVDFNNETISFTRQLIKI